MLSVQNANSLASGGDPSAFAVAPSSWYYLCDAARLARERVSLSIGGGQEFVGYMTADGRPVVLSARCSHMGSHLVRGCVRGDRLQCPLHGWEYGADGRCTHIPAGGAVPEFARQASFPTQLVGDQVFFFNGPSPRFPMPFFDGLAPEQLLAAPVFEFEVDAPWHLVAANGFDVQHFRWTHDRTLDGEPKVGPVHDFAWRLRAAFTVTGAGLPDRLTRLFSGRRVEMEVTNWSGNLIFVSARFRRTASHGIVSFIPLGGERTLVRDIVWVPRSRSALGRLLVDPLDARIRRWFIREFLKSDVERSDGLRFDARRMIAADAVLVSYLEWLRTRHR